MDGTTPEAAGTGAGRGGRGRPGRQLRRGPGGLPRGARADGRRTTAASPLLIMPNAGLPSRVEGQFVYAAGPAYFAESVPRFLAAGRAAHRWLLRHDARAHRGDAPGARPGAGARARHGGRDRGVRGHAGCRRRAPDRGHGARRRPVRTTQERAAAHRPRRASSAEGRFVISVEIDPPRSVRIERTLEAARLLAEAGVDLVNISDSAMARVRMSAMAVAFGIQHDLDLECLVHFTTRDRNLMALESELLGAHALGVRDILALTGDPPRIGDYPTGTGIWDIDSTGLIGVIQRLNRGEDQAGKPIGAPAGFTVACALDPTAGDLEHELDRLTGKLDAGADLIMTQPIYAREQWDRFMERASRRWGDRLPRPVLLGVLPLHTSRHAEFLHNEVPGITIPDRGPGRHGRGRRPGRGGRAGAGHGAAVGHPRPGPGHLRHAQLRALRAERGAGPATAGDRAGAAERRSADPPDAPRAASRGCAARSLGYAPRVMHGRRRAGLHRAILALARGDVAAVDAGRASRLGGRAALPRPAAPAPTSSTTPRSSTGRPRQGVEEGCEPSSTSRGVDIVVLHPGQAAPPATRPTPTPMPRRCWSSGASAAADGHGRRACSGTSTARRTRALVSLALGDGLAARRRRGGDCRPQVEASMADALRTDDWVNALNRGVFALTAAIPAAPADTAAPAPGRAGTGQPARDAAPDGRARRAGPAGRRRPVRPTRPPSRGSRVYDYADVLSPATRQRAAATIAGIEDRTGAQVVVYTQVKPESDTPERRRARCHRAHRPVRRRPQGLRRRPGHPVRPRRRASATARSSCTRRPAIAASYLTNADRQAIYRGRHAAAPRGACDIGRRAGRGLAQDRCRDHRRARQPAAAGPPGGCRDRPRPGPAGALALVGWAGWSWLRYGRDPEYLDDPSVLMPAPPPGLTPAAAAVVLDGRVNRHALTTALVDLAGRGELRFRQPGAMRRARPSTCSSPTRPTRACCATGTRPLGAPEACVRDRLRGIRGRRRARSTPTS